MIWFKTIAPALCYFLYNWQFFRGTECVRSVVPLRMRAIICTFLINYGVFFLCSVMHLHLIVNWIIFLILLSAEQRIMYQQPTKECFLLALMGTQFGLAANILFRSLFAVILNVPLYAFDNRITYAGNMKSYPIILGFLAGGIFFMLVKNLGWLKNISLIIENNSTLVFLLSLLTAMYGYLCMNLVVYYIGENNFVLKLWSMKSSVFVMVGEWLSIMLSIRMGQLAQYRTKVQESREAMALEMTRELELRTIAGTDPLTGCENRYRAVRCLQEALNKKRKFCLCFVDLNGLKNVNDSFGHEIGDNYLKAVADALRQSCDLEDALFRYGGDEFLIIFFDIEVETAEQRLVQAQKQLKETEEYPFLMLISYGITSSDEVQESQELIQTADDRMYNMKLKVGKQL